MRYFNKVTFICIFLMVSISSNAQLVITQQMIDRMDGTLPQENLDKGIYRCIYHFTQQVEDRRSKEIVVLTDTMALDFGKHFSVYYDWNKSVRDSLQRVVVDNLTITHIDVNTNPNHDMVEFRDEVGNYFTQSPKGENAEIFKNRLQNEVSSIYTASMESFKCVENLDPQSWQFSSDTLRVLGYLCQKATTSFRGREYTAWFAPEIPINEGPWKLFGLPGLILKANTSDGIFSFEAIGLENLKELFISMDKDTYSNCTRQEFAKYRAKKRDRLLARHYMNGRLIVGGTPNPYIFHDLELE